jgi:hypothetical protein
LLPDCPLLLPSRRAGATHRPVALVVAVDAFLD